jgi:carbon storage regulator CsrA
MLVISRKQNERIRIVVPDGPTIWLTLCSHQGNKARIGIDAPPSVKIDREELLIRTAWGAVGEETS